MNEDHSIHSKIKDKLDHFIKIKKIPNIIFHGPSGSGKRTIVYSFIDKIYNSDRQIKQNYVLFVNCAQGKGIKFIRDELKFFAKTHINYREGHFFKSIILSNADKLTIDAQSALRRCIELFSHTTRFFIIVEDKYKLLKPILSRFSEIYIPYVIYNKNQINLYKYNLGNLDENPNQNVFIKKLLKNHKTVKDLHESAEVLYEKGITGLDLTNYIINNYDEDILKYKLLLIIQKIKKEFRSEKLIIFFIVYLISFRSDNDLENMLNM